MRIPFSYRQLGTKHLALGDRIGFGDGERDLIRQADADRLFFVKFDGDHHAVLQEGGQGLGETSQFELVQDSRVMKISASPCS